MPLSLSGTTGIVTGNIAASNITTATIADNNVTTAKILNANVTPAKLSQPMTLMTGQNALTTFIDFTGIPSWVKRITVMLNAVSTNGSSLQIIQIGTSAGIENSGYTSGGTYLPTAGPNYLSTPQGFNIPAGNASSIQSGNVQICYMGSNTWTFSYAGVNTGENGCSIGGGVKTLSNTLDRVRITTVNGTDTFDAGSINIMYEG